MASSFPAAVVDTELALVGRVALALSGRPFHLGRGIWGALLAGGPKMNTPCLNGILKSENQLVY